jgi:carbon-monoxide dehydrogenase catalytic subunit
MCEKTGINTNQDTNQLVIQLAELLDRELKVNPDQDSIMVEAFAPKVRSMKCHIIRRKQTKWRINAFK